MYKRSKRTVARLGQNGSEKFERTSYMLDISINGCSDNDDESHLTWPPCFWRLCRLPLQLNVLS